MWCWIIICGVPQRFVLGSLLFTLYTSLLYFTLLFFWTRRHFDYHAHQNLSINIFVEDEDNSKAAKSKRTQNIRNCVFFIAQFAEKSPFCLSALIYCRFHFKKSCNFSRRIDESLINYVSLEQNTDDDFSLWRNSAFLALCNRFPS